MHPQELHERRGDVQIIDVRETYEWRAGRLEGSEHIPIGEITGRLDEIGEGGAVVAVCRSGARSGQVVAWLRQQGYDAHNLDGGLQAWAAEDLPLTTPDGAPGHVA